MAKLAKEIHLGSEDEAWEFLRKLIKREIEIAHIPHLTVGPWARIDVYIPEDKYNSSITPHMMKGWVELQRSIYRSYSLASGGDAEARSLTDQEKEQLELIVEVKSGSSDQGVDVQAVIEKFMSAMVDKMDPQQILIVAISMILAFAGNSVMQSWLAARKEVKLAEIEALRSKTAAEAHIAALATIAEVAGVERARAKLLKLAVRDAPVLSSIQAEADKGREALVKHMTKDGAVVNGVQITAEAGKSVTTRTRMEASEVRLDGLYRIRSC